ncbi:MAG: PQQ-dependent sugar dehydrogenase [Planctomycetaceae bacterium]|nr:PQQ-dependent sugar dehydrogenase [Planctomycetaceae bacterium]
MKLALKHRQSQFRSRQLPPSTAGFLLAMTSLCTSLVQADTPTPPFELNVYREYALTHDGDSAAGKQLFEKHEKLTCTACHGVAAKEKAGPDLDGIGSKYQREELIRSVLEPSHSIKPGYEQAMILKKDGKLLNGRLERATKLAVRLLDTKGIQTDLNMSDIEELKFSEKSLMPDNVVASITREEFADLIAYLQSLRFMVHSGLKAGGEEVPIPRLSKPITLHQLNPEDLRFENPVWCGAIPGLPGELAVIEHQRARVWRYLRDAKPPRSELFVDLSEETHISGNQGVMCIAFHPDYPNNGRYFLEHEVHENGQVKTAIVERRASDDRRQDSGRPSIRLLDVDQPAYNHNGGCIAFGCDGMLYAGFGDGGPQRDPPGNSQNLRILLGSMIRIDIDHADGDRSYSFPEDNPFLAAHRADPAVRPETWAYGFREPWRFSFDCLTGDLWVGDVGQDTFEEIDIVKPGRNYGWNVREGFAPFSDQYQRELETYTDPLFAYAHGLGFSATGGHVYRADPESSFCGVYIFGDYNTRRIWGLRQQDGKLLDVRELGTSPGGIVSFGLDENGELLMVTYGGLIYQLDLSQAEYK